MELFEIVEKAKPIKFVKSYSKYGTESWLCPNCRRKIKKNGNTTIIIVLSVVRKLNGVIKNESTEMGFYKSRI